MNTKKKTYEDAIKFVTMVAKKQNWKLNPDSDFIEIIINGLKKNFNRYGYFSCPCRDADGKREKDADIICPCDYCRPDQDEYGHCYCGLFLLLNFFETGKIPEQIPERRI